MNDYNNVHRDDQYVNIDRSKQETTHQQEMMLMSNLTKAPGPTVYTYGTMPNGDAINQGQQTNGQQFAMGRVSIKA